MYEKPYYQSPYNPNDNTNGQGKSRHSVYIGVIIGLAVLSMVLAMLLIAGASDVADEPEEVYVQPPVVAAPSYNSDSAELAELRDSLRSATGSSAGGLFAAVSLDKMNVLYIGVDNPVSIGVGGILPADLVVSISGGTLAATGKPGNYIARVNSGTKATLTVSAKVNGVTKTVGSYEYRIKRIPDPVAYVGTVKGSGKMTKAELAATAGVFARMENFDFECSYQVVSFVMSMNVNGVDIEKMANGPSVTADMKTLLNGAKPGNRVLFKDITVKGPDGTLRKIPPVIIVVS